MVELGPKNESIINDLLHQDQALSGWIMNEYIFGITSLPNHKLVHSGE